MARAPRTLDTLGRLLAAASKAIWHNRPRLNARLTYAAGLLRDELVAARLAAGEGSIAANDYVSRQSQALAIAHGWQP